MSRVKLPPYQRKKSSTSSLFIIPQPPPSAIKMSGETVELPSGTVCLDNQVAGHVFGQGPETIAMLKNLDDGSVMKPITKPLCGTREINFYELVASETSDPDVVPLKELIPEYRGTQTMKVQGREIDFIRLTDLTQDMLEPCILDVKIGKRTWDPLASDAKRVSEDAKYKACKDKLGLCLPGFQVYSISSGKVKRYGREYGKKLTPAGIKDAFRIYLNADIGLDHQLVTEFLTVLTKVQTWAHAQTKFRLYASSLLFVYDARRLRHHKTYHTKTGSPPNGKLNGHTNGATPAGDAKQDVIEPTRHYYQIQRCHSTTNNYDQDYKEMRQQYELMLDSLVLESVHKKEWATIKMIDFAHVFETPTDERGTRDENYVFGVDNLVEMFEEFLKECEQ